MELNLIEKTLMNNPVRRAVQRGYEATKLAQMGGAMNGGLALEVGCGSGTGAEIILDRFCAGEVHAFDLDPDMVRRASRRLRPRGATVRLWTGSATEIAAEDDTYDAVFDFGTIHHIPNWRLAIEEVYRVLRPGGRFYLEEILVAFIHHPFWVRLLDHPMEDRFDLLDLTHVMQSTGFDLVGTDTLDPHVGWVVADKPTSG